MMAAFEMAPEDCYMVVHLFEHFSPETTPYPGFSTPGATTCINEPEWTALVQHSQSNRSRAPKRVIWLSNEWFASMLKCGYSLSRCACDYLVFPGCSLLLTTGEWLLGEAGTAEWIVGLTASIPLTQLLPLWWEPARDIFAAIPQAPATGVTSMYLLPQFAARILERCVPSQLQMAYRVTWDKGLTLISDMTRIQIAEHMVDIGMSDLASHPISSSFRLDERLLVPNDLVQKVGELQSSQLWSTWENAVVDYQCRETGKATSDHALSPYWQTALHTNADGRVEDTP